MPLYQLSAYLSDGTKLVAGRAIHTTTAAESTSSTQRVRRIRLATKPEQAATVRLDLLPALDGSEPVTTEQDDLAARSHNDRLGPDEEEIVAIRPIVYEGTWHLA